MALNATFYKFAKKKNSTARPSGGTLETIELKDTCNMLSPTIKLNQTTYPDYNYCYLELTDRYYYVNSIRWIRGLWELDMEVDALASWKNSIGAQSLYVTRCETSFNPDIMDTTYPVRSEPTQQLIPPNSGGSPWELDEVSDGTFVVGIIGSDIVYYAFSFINYQQFMRNLYAELYLSQIVPVWSLEFEDIKARFNPLQYITSVVWFPFDFWDSDIIDIDVGYGTVNGVCLELDGTQTQRIVRSFTIPTHPQASARGRYLNARPYSDYSLFFPPFGKIALDSNVLVDSESDLLDALIDIDVRTGEGTLSIQAGESGSNILGWVTAKVGVDYQVSQVANGGMSIGQVAQAGAGIIGGAVFGGVAGAVGGAIAGGVSAIGSYVEGKIPTASTIGGRGGVNSLKGLPQLIVENYLLVDEDLTHRGRPLCEVRLISGIPDVGYLVVQPADISIAAESSELDSIKRYMEGGFYYE